MIERLLIQNFQAHAKLRVDFDPAITTIVGPSDVGKSAIIRALRWACTNQPGGDAYVRHGTKGATVRLVVDGHTITRRRKTGGGTNEYLLDDKEYVAFGRGVPDPIADRLNLGVVSWQGQHDAPYWFSDTAGEVSRQLNAIVNLGIIDSTMANVARALHRARTKLEMAEEGLTEAKGEHDALGWVPGFEAAVVVVEDAEGLFTVAARQAADIATLVTGAQRHQDRHERATRATLAADSMVTAGAAALKARRWAKTVDDLVAAARQATLEAETPVPDVGPMQAALDTYNASTKRSTAVLALLEDIETKTATLLISEGALKDAERKVPKQCPTCGK